MNVSIDTKLYKICRNGPAMARHGPILGQNEARHLLRRCSNSSHASGRPCLTQIGPKQAEIGPARCPKGSYRPQLLARRVWARGEPRRPHSRQFPCLDAGSLVAKTSKNTRTHNFFASHLRRTNMTAPLAFGLRPGGWASWESCAGLA